MTMNPKQILEQLTPRIGNQPMLNNVINLMNSGRDDEVLKVARNFCKTQGIDFDTEFKKFMQSPLNNLNRLMHQ